MTNQRLENATDEAFPNYPKRRRGTPRPGNGAKRRIDREQVRTLTLEGHTAADIAEQLRCSTSSVTQIRIKLGIANPNYAQLTPERLAKIKQWLDDGWSFAEITRTDGVTFETLKYHFPGRQWTPEQRLDHLRALRIGRTHHFNGAPQRSHL